MRAREYIALFVPVAILCVAIATHEIQAQTSPGHFRPAVPRTLDDAALATLEVPLAEARYSPVHVSSGCSRGEVKLNSDGGLADGADLPGPYDVLMARAQIE